MDSILHWLKSIPVAASLGVLTSLAGFLVSTLVTYSRRRAERARLVKVKEQVEKLREQAETELEVSRKNLDSLLGQVISTSTAQAPGGIAEGPASIAQLRQQVSEIEQKMRTQRNEIVEVSKIDPVLEATIKASIDNLTKRIEFLEKNRLEKWDVALVVFQVLSGMSVIVGLVLGLIKYFAVRGLP